MESMTPPTAPVVATPMRKPKKSFYMRTNKFVTALMLIFVFLPAPVVSAHGGGLDSSGGHNCNVGSCAGTYHCHRPSWGCGVGYSKPSYTPVIPSFCVSLTGQYLTVAEVQRIEFALLSKGFNPGPIDGAIGRVTSRAINQFENSRGLAVSSQGRIYHGTISALGIAC
jgi:hypothetical protein